MGLFHSIDKKRIIPEIIRKRVPYIMILVCIVNLFDNFLFSYISSKTKKPIPPKIIKNESVKTIPLPKIAQKR